jgi:SAM-dependent methyltransferase
MPAEKVSLPREDFTRLFHLFGPSLGLWRGAEIAVLRQEKFPTPVLDLGCGNGLVTSFILPRVDIGLDPDRTALSHAQSLGIYRQVIPSGMEDSQLAPDSLGSIVSNSVLEHIPGIDAVLIAAAQALRPGGKLIFTVPTEDFSCSLLLRGHGYAAQRNRQLQHRNLWPADEWQQRLARAGLKVIKVRPYLRSGWVRTWDALELLQMVSLGKIRLLGRAWRRMPPTLIARLAQRAALIDLSALPPGGGRLVVAEKPG